MSTMWDEDLDSEGAEYDDSDFAEYDDSDLDSVEGGEDLDAEYRRRTRREMQARRIALARRRQARARASVRRPAVAAAPVPAAPTSTSTAIRTLDLETKVADDSFRRALAAHRARMNRSDYAAVAGAAMGQFLESFDEPDNEYARAALRFAPLLLLSPQKRGSGIGGFVADPRVIGAAAVLGITYVGRERSEFRSATAIAVTSIPTLKAGQQFTFFADVVNRRGQVVPGSTVAWDTADPAVATVDATGKVSAVATGPVYIIVKAPGLPDRRIPLLVE